MHFQIGDNDPNMRGKKKARKTTRAGGAGREELLRIAQEQNAIIQQEKEELVQKIKAEAEAVAAEAAAAAAAKAEAEAKARAEAEIKAKARAEAKAKLKTKEKSSATEKGKVAKRAKGKVELSVDNEDKGDRGEIEEDTEENTENEDFEGRDDGEQEEEVKGVHTGAGETTSSEPQQGEAHVEETTTQDAEGEEPIKGKRKRLRAGMLVSDKVIGKILCIRKQYQFQLIHACINIHHNKSLVMLL